jgi:hypothetical protein
MIEENLRSNRLQYLPLREQKKKKLDSPYFIIAHKLIAFFLIKRIAGDLSKHVFK